MPALDRYFTLVSESTLLDEPGLQPLRLELIEAAISYYENFVSRRRDDPQVQLELAATHLRLAQIYRSMQRDRDWLSSIEQGFALVEKAMQQHPAKSKAYLALAGFWHGGRNMPGPHQPITDKSHALAVMQKGVGLWERLVELHPTVAGFQSDLSKFYHMMLQGQHDLGRREGALRSVRKVVEIRKNLVIAHPDIPIYKAELSYGYWISAKLVDSDPQQAEDLYRRAITVQQEADFLPYRQNLAGMHSSFAQFLQQRNRPDEAIKECRQAMAIYEKLVEEYPRISGYLTNLTSSQRLLADLLGSAPVVTPIPEQTISPDRGGSQ